MGYNRKYQMQFTQAITERLVTVDIWDRSYYTDTETDVFIYTLIGGEEPCRISVVDNDEDKFTPIKAKEARIQFLSDSDVNLATFAAGEDNRWYVHIYYNDEISEYTGWPRTLFIGFLALDNFEVEEDFLDSENNNTITLVAHDGLGLLKDIPWVNMTDENPQGKTRLSEVVAWALRKTGAESPPVITEPIYPLYVAIICNLREETQPDYFDYPWLNTFLEAKTFEAEIGECEDCYSVLTKILNAFGCFVTQWEGLWFIVRVDEIDTAGYIITHYDNDGEIRLPNDDTPLFLNQEIGKAYDSFFINEETFVTLRRPLKKVIETYNHLYPKEIVDNIDFTRGDLRTPDVVEGGAAYEVEDWTVIKTTASDPLFDDFWNFTTTPTKIARIIRKYDVNNYETERYVETEADSSDTHFLASNPVPVHLYDRVSVSVDTRYAGFDLFIVLFGDSGKWYNWNVSSTGPFDEPEAWRNLSLDISTTEGVMYESPGGAPAAIPILNSIPEDGDLVIYFHFTTNPDTEPAHWSNLQFTYTPYINGTYQKYRAQQHTITNPLNYKAVRDEEVYISDSPKKLFKGAMFKLVDGNYVLTQRWYDASKNPTPSTTASKPLIYFGHRMNIVGDANYVHQGWYFYLDDVPTPGYYLITEYQDDDSSTFIAFPSPSGTIDYNALEFKGATTDEVILNTRFANHYFTNDEDGPTTTATYLTIENYPATVDYVMPFGELQAHSVWNQHNRVFRMFDASVQGLTGNPDLIHKYFLQDTSPHTGNKYFMLLHYDMNLYTEEWQGVFIEVRDMTIEKEYTNHSFKYITER